MNASAAVDLRSDTVTRPTDSMRRAMATAEVGDDTFGEDPTVRRLEEMAAELLGTEAALFVPSGIMGNEIALHLLAPAGSEVVCGAESHLIEWEMAAMAVLSGLLPRAIATVDGLMDPRGVERGINRDERYRTPTGLLSVENTVNMAGGRVYDGARLKALLDVARRHGLPAHLDGARLFNAAVALDVDVRELSRGFDATLVCLSKGLGAPVGSMLCGSREFVGEAWRVRRMLGGGMRQAGVVAAAGIEALTEGPAYLAADHARARKLGAQLAERPDVGVDPEAIETNIVIFEVADSAAWVEALAARRVRAVAIAPERVRLVTHRDFDDFGLAVALDAIAEIPAGVPIER